MDKYIGFDIDCKKTATSLRPGVWPDFPGSDFKFILAFEEIGFELGLFFWGLRVVHFHNPFVKKRLRSFWAINEIGFVYSD